VIKLIPVVCLFAGARLAAAPLTRSVVGEYVGWYYNNAGPPHEAAAKARNFGRSGLEISLLTADQQGRTQFYG